MSFVHKQKYEKNNSTNKIPLVVVPGVPIGACFLLWVAVEASGTISGGLFGCGADGAEDEEKDDMNQKEQEEEALERERRLAGATHALLVSG